MILTGRYGQVLYNEPPVPSPATPVIVTSLNTWKMSQKTDKINVTCFGNSNKVYVNGLKDVAGTVGGFWDSDELTLFKAVDAATPGLLRLVPNTTDPTPDAGAFEGLAYLDVDIDTMVEGAPKVTGNFVAAGNWSLNLLP
jgi:hypothetical protein